MSIVSFLNKLNRENDFLNIILKNKENIPPKNADLSRQLDSCRQQEPVGLTVRKWLEAKAFLGKYIIFTITLTFIFFLSLQQNLKADATCTCSDDDGGGNRRSFSSIPQDSTHCNIIKNLCQQEDNLNKRKQNDCPIVGGSNSQSQAAVQVQLSRQECIGDINRELDQVQNSIQRKLNEVQQDRERYERECRQEREDLSKISLPPGCDGRERNCRTEAEKCHDVQQRLGIANSLTPALQNILGSDCPQLAEAKYEDDKERLDRVVGDQRESLESIWTLQEEVQTNQEEYQKAVQDSQEEIQSLTTQLTAATTEYEGQVNRASAEISGRVAEMKDESLRINQEIRGLSRKLNELQTDNNAEADQAAIEYRNKVRSIFSRCNGQANARVQQLRELFQIQAASGETNQLSDATQAGRIERFRQTAIRAYARCRNSQGTENELAEAAEIYESRQRARIREEGELTDQITSLKERLEEISVASEDIVTAGDRAFQTAHAQHVSTLDDLGTKLTLAHFNKDQLLGRFQQQQQNIQAKLDIENPRLEKLSGEMLALEQSVDVGRPNSFLARLSNDDFQELSDYTSQLDIAKDYCCGSHVPRNIRDGSDICNKNARSILRSRGRTSRATR